VACGGLCLEGGGQWEGGRMWEVDKARKETLEFVTIIVY